MNPVNALAAAARRHPWCAHLPGLFATAMLGGLFLLTVPAAWGQSPDAQPTPPPPVEECRVGAYVVNLNELDLVKKSFQIEVWLWAVSLKQPEPLKTLEILDAHDVKSQGVRSEKTSDPYQNFGADRQVFYSSRKVTATVRHSWDVVNYPFDRHVLTVEMEDALNPDEKIVFVPDTEHTRLRKDLRVEGWKVTDVSFTVRRKVYDMSFGDPTQADAGGSGFSRLVLAISIEREVRTSFLKLTAGVYAAFVLALLGFFYDTEQASLMSPRTSIVVGSLFAAIVNMRGVESVLGRTESLTLVDKIHIFTIAYIFVAAAACIGSRLLCEKNRRPLALFLDRRVLFPIFLVTYLVLNSVLIWQATYVG